VFSFCSTGCNRKKRREGRNGPTGVFYHRASSSKEGGLAMPPLYVFFIAGPVAARGRGGAAGVKQQPPMHQFRMRPFKPFWVWTKNTSSCLAQGFFSPLFCPKIFPSYLLPPLLPTSALLPPSPHFLLTPSPKLRRTHELE
jgi:hypothetical protein